MNTNWNLDNISPSVDSTEFKTDIENYRKAVDNLNKWCSENFTNTNNPQEKLEKYNMEKEVVRPKSEATIKKFQKQPLTTDTGIEITIPMEEYKDPEKVEFITNPDGTISVLIKNIGHLSTR